MLHVVCSRALSFSLYHTEFTIPFIHFGSTQIQSVTFLSVTKMVSDANTATKEQEDLMSLSREGLVDKVLELQDVLSDLTWKVDQIKEENSGMKHENVVLKDYIDNLMEKVSRMQQMQGQSGDLQPSHQ